MLKMRYDDGAFYIVTATGSRSRIDISYISKATLKQIETNYE